MLIIVGECDDDFEELRGKLMEEWDPQSVLESELVEGLAGDLWRLRRVPFFEAAILAYRQGQVLEENAERQTRSFRPPYLDPEQLDEREGENAEEEMSDEDLSVHMGEAFIRDAAWGDGLGKLARHKAALMNSVMKTVQMLLLLQDNRLKRKSSPVQIEAVALKRVA
jgi:hypothetical protein